MCVVQVRGAGRRPSDFERGPGDGGVHHDQVRQSVGRLARHRVHVDVHVDQLGRRHGGEKGSLSARRLLQRVPGRPEQQGRVRRVPNAFAAQEQGPAVAPQQEPAPVPVDLSQLLLAPGRHTGAAGGRKGRRGRWRDDRHETVRRPVPRPARSRLQTPGTVHRRVLGVRGPPVHHDHIPYVG